MPVRPKRYPKELFLEWQDGQWILTTPKGKHDMQIVRNYNAAQHPLPLIIESVKHHAATYPEGAELTIIRGKGWKNQETITFPPHP